MSPRIVLIHAGICDASMWDGFEVPQEAFIAALSTSGPGEKTSK